MERTVVMDKSKGEPVISVKATSRSKDRVSINRQGWDRAPSLTSLGGDLAGIFCLALPTSSRGPEAWTVDSRGI